MEPVRISVQNLSTVVTDADAQEMVRALAVQAVSDYNTSCWVTENLSAPCQSVTLIPKGEPVPEGTWHMELLDDSTQPGALGVHLDKRFNSEGPVTAPRKASTHSARGLRADAPELPLMEIYAKTAIADGAAVSEVASHEMLEALVDPQVMQIPRTVIDPATGQKWIVEVGDPVQETGYTINGIRMANFALPAEFGYPQKVNPTQYDFRRILLAPFSLTVGGYMSVSPPNSEEWTQIHG